MNISLPTVQSPTDLLAVVPYLLGFTPERSVVVVATRQRRLVFQARADLPAAEEVPAVAGHLATVIARQRVDTALLVAYGTEAEVGSTVDELRSALGARRIAVVEALRADQGRYWSYVCRRPDCCPPAGTPYDVATTAIAAGATYAGLSHAASRAELVARLAPVDGVARTAMGEAARAADRRLGALIERALGAGASQTLSAPPGTPVPEDVARITRDAVFEAGVAAVDTLHTKIGGIAPPDDDAVAWLGLLLVSVRVRDYAWERIERRTDGCVELWSDIVRRVQPELAAAPATLLAFAAWRAGDGAVASIALDRAFDADPAYPMARLLSDAIDNGLSPRTFLDVAPPAPVRSRRGRRSHRLRVLPPAA